MSKIMKILLSASMIVLIMALWIGCSNTSSSTSRGNQPTSSSTQNTPDSTGQQTSNPSEGQQSGNRPMGGDNSQMNQVASRVAEILNISEDEFLTAFQTAMSNHMPEASEREGQQPPQGEPPESMGEPPEEPEERPEGEEPPEMQPGQQGGQGPGFDMEEIYDEMSEILGISADDIAAAFEQAQQELSQ